jgi:hypothetical protein
MRASKSNSTQRRPVQGGGSTAQQSSETPSLENDPGVERGERIATGKMIARGGKSSGEVAGANEGTTVGQTAKSASPAKESRESVHEE